MNLRETNMGYMEMEPLTEEMEGKAPPVNLRLSHLSQSLAYSLAHNIFASLLPGLCLP